MVTKVTTAAIPHVLLSSAVTQNHNNLDMSRMALAPSRFAIVGGLKKQQIPTAGLEPSCVAIVGQVRPVTRASCFDVLQTSLALNWKIHRAAWVGRLRKENVREQLR